MKNMKEMKLRFQMVATGVGFLTWILRILFRGYHLGRFDGLGGQGWEFLTHRRRLDLEC